MSKKQLDINLSDEDSDTEIDKNMEYVKKMIKENKKEPDPYYEDLNNKIQSIADMIRNGVPAPKKKRKYRELTEEEKEFRRQLLVKAREKKKLNKEKNKEVKEEPEEKIDVDYDQQEKKKQIVEKNKKPKPAFKPICMTDLPPKKNYVLPIYH